MASVRRRGLPHLPPALRPLSKAYALGAISTSAPKLFGLALAVLQRKQNMAHAVSELQLVLGHATDPRRFPAFCAILVGGSTLLQTAFFDLLSGLTPLTNAGTLTGLARFLASFVAAAVGFHLLNTKPRSHAANDNVARAAESDADPLQSSQPGGAAARPRSKSTAERALRNVAPFTIKPPRRRVERLLSDAGLYTIPSDLLAGRTIDLTLFAFVRALDVLGSARTRSKTRPESKQIWWHVDWATTFFTISCATIMNAWFYAPDRLPPTYNAWISKAAQLDVRVLEALRRCRRAEFVYGTETGQADLLGQVCQEEGLPCIWGDPAKTIPVREEIVDCSIALSGRPWRLGLDTKGHRPSGLYLLMSKFAKGSLGCERHAIMRFLQGWYFAALMYFPLQLVGLGVRLYGLPSPKRSPHRYFTELMVAVRSAARSASFLGAFIALVYYGVSLGRHRIGPKALHMVLKYRDMHSGKHSGNGFRIPGIDLLFGTEIAAGKVASNACLAEYLEMQAAGEPSVFLGHAQLSKERRRREVAQMLDGGLAVNLGCWLCGLSLLAEEPRRRVEIMLFVAPRAVGAWVPRVYNRRYLWREQIAFAASAAVILTAVQERPGSVRGFFGKVLASIMATSETR